MTDYLILKKNNLRHSLMLTTWLELDIWWDRRTKSLESTRK